MTHLSRWLETHLPRPLVPWILTAIYALTLLAILLLIDLPNVNFIYLDINAVE